MVVSYAVTPANVHDSACLEGLLDEGDKDLRGDSAFVGEQLHAGILKRYPHLQLHIHEKGYRNRPLTETQKEHNKEKCAHCG